MEASILSFLLFLLEGVPVTIVLTLLSLTLGFVIGLPLALARAFGKGIPSFIAAGYERTLRSIPLLVLLFIFYFGFNYEWMTSFVAAMLAMGLRSAAYQSQIFRGSIASIQADQMAAARSLGMTKLQAISRVILPQALTLSLPSWANEFAVVIKDTSFAYAIGVVEVMRRANYLRAATLRPLPPFLLVAAIYFLITFPITKFFGSRGTKRKKLWGYE